MGSIRSRDGVLFFDFRLNGMRCREQTLLEDTAMNRKKLETFMKQIDLEILQGAFDYRKYFPNSKNLEKVAATISNHVVKTADSRTSEGVTPLFKDFSEDWYEENLVRWKRSHQETVRGILDKHLVPRFGELEVSCITKGDILKFRSSLAKVVIGKKTGLSPMRINHIMTSLRMILNDAADRFDFNTPFRGIKPLRIPKTDIDPFTIDEVRHFLKFVRNDFQNYYTVRFFSAMRTGEIDGLKWKYVDLHRREILVRETLVRMREESTKTPGSVREIKMSDLVYQALKRQWEVTGNQSEFVFCNRNGSPFDHCNITKRIWYPTLKVLGMKTRRPYQTRHTTATLWLASGENPEWIAKQMGHSTTAMLFTVYSRFVPNLTRKDGSAFEHLLNTRINGGESYAQH